MRTMWPRVFPSSVQATLTSAKARTLPGFIVLALMLGLGGCRPKTHEPPAPPPTRVQRPPEPTPTETLPALAVVYQEANELRCWDPESDKAWTAADNVPGIAEAAIDPTGRWLAYTNEDGDLFVLDLESGVQRTVRDEPGATFLTMAWARAGEKLAFTADGQLLVARAPDWQARMLVEERECGWPTWSADGKEIAYGLRDADDSKGKGLWAVSETDGTPRRLAPGTGDIFAAARPVYSPDGTWIAFEHSWEGGSLNLVRSDSSKYRADICEGSNPHWVNDDVVVFRVVAEAEADGLWSYTASTRRAERLCSRGQWVDFAVDPRGEGVALLQSNAGGDNAAAKVLWYDMATKQVTDLGSATCRRAEGPLFSEDGRLFALATYGPDPELPQAPATQGAIRVYRRASEHVADSEVVCERLIGWITAETDRDRGEAE